MYQPDICLTYLCNWQQNYMETCKGNVRIWYDRASFMSVWYGRTTFMQNWIWQSITSRQIPSGVIYHINCVYHSKELQWCHHNSGLVWLRVYYRQTYNRRFPIHLLPGYTKLENGYYIPTHQSFSSCIHTSIWTSIAHASHPKRYARCFVSHCFGGVIPWFIMDSPYVSSYIIYSYSYTILWWAMKYSYLTLVGMITT